ncbi:Gfo/Idh/MocA family protein [Streptomyces sp. NPDC098789]|uniref:Gfo/Idh/MocA family protein n=1 Tax=Streptomyces sp. NPDC098789 TaxID=3366098 RepID=UPI00380DEDA8
MTPHPHHPPATPVTLALVGAGLRGLTYARHAHATGAGRVTTLAEPDPIRRAAAAAEFGVPPDRVHPHWRALAAAGRHADAAIIATQDRMHTGPAVALAATGHHLLVEKPMAAEEPEAERIAAAAERHGVLLAVCHVLRYTSYSRTLKALLDEGRIGRLVGAEHLEPVGWWHFAHSFVRGNWRRSDTSGPLLLTKACHDLDWLVHLFGRSPATVMSYGRRTHFRPEGAPPGAAARCTDCAVEPDCPYSAPRLYLDCLGDPRREFWPLSAVTPEPTAAAVREALRTGPYGRCVYACDNDAADHQVVVMEFADGATATFTVSAFTPMGDRRTRLFGTHGHIEGDGATLRVTDFRTGREELVAPAGGSPQGGHGGGDLALTEAFLAAVATGDADLLLSGPRTSLATHRLVWAAERARALGAPVDVPQ